MLTLMVGLGNPGPTYANNRHNVGFLAVDRIHARWRGGPWRRKFQGEISEAKVGDARLMFLKPMTFMNESGRSVADAVRFYKLDVADIVVVHDEIDLVPGRFRMKVGGGTGGHNGLRSVTAHVKDGYRRLRIGVGHPGRKEMVPSYVLHDFAKADADWLEPMLDAFAEEAGLIAQGKDGAFASKVHERLGKDSIEGKDSIKGKGTGEAAADTAAERGPLARREASPVQSASPRTSTSPFALLSHILKR